MTRYPICRTRFAIISPNTPKNTRAFTFASLVCVAVIPFSVVPCMILSCVLCDMSVSACTIALYACTRLGPRLYASAFAPSGIAAADPGAMTYSSAFATPERNMGFITSRLIPSTSKRSSSVIFLSSQNSLNDALLNHRKRPLGSIGSKPDIAMLYSGMVYHDPSRPSTMRRCLIRFSIEYTLL